MSKGFAGFSPEAMVFLRDLVKNNDREWFAPRKAVFEEQLKLPMLELVQAIHGKMLSFAPDYVGEPAKCLFRIYRDTRFSKDKTPYKNHIAASFWRNGLEKNQAAGFYFAISPKEVEIAAGLYSPDPATLLSVRQLIAESPETFKSTFMKPAQRKLLGDLQGETASRAPKGFDPGHAEIELLKRKQYCFFNMLEPGLATTPKLFSEVVRRFEAMTPFVEFLNRPLVGRKRMAL